jgi:hypothetical protein
MHNIIIICINNHATINITEDSKTLLCALQNYHGHVKEYLQNLWAFWASTIRKVCQHYPRLQDLTIRTYLSSTHYTSKHFGQG